VRAHHDDRDKNGKPAKNVEHENGAFCERKDTNEESVESPSEDDDGVEEERTLEVVQLLSPAYCPWEGETCVPSLEVIVWIVEYHQALDDCAAEVGTARKIGLPR